MNPKPPRAAAGLVELFAPIESAESVLGDLEEEFAGRLTRSGRQAARRWYWRQATRTTVHLLLGSIRTRPWSTTALVLASFVMASLLYGMMSVWIGRLVSNLPIFDYDTSVWSWRAATLVRFVGLPLALGWSIAALARGREMIITTLVVGVLVGMLLLTLTVNARLLVLGPGQRLGLYWALMHVFEVFLVQSIFPLCVLFGGMMRRFQQLRGSARVAA
jgi:hypothetical protein